MSQATVSDVGGVVSEKRVLSFSSRPPSPAGANYLPQTVYQNRGHRSFAMNQYTQLQLCVEPHRDTSGIATSFHPLPSPVIIDKPFVGGGMLSERLSLAVRLAKRDVLNGKRLSPCAAGCRDHSFQENSCSSFLEETLPDTTADNSSPQPHEPTHEYTGTNSEQLNRQCTGTTSKQLNRQYTGTTSKQFNHQFTGTSSKQLNRQYTGTTSKQLNRQCTGTTSKQLNRQCTGTPSKQLNRQYTGTTSKQLNRQCTGTTSKQLNRQRTGTTSKLSPLQSTPSSRELNDLKDELQRQINVLKQLIGNKQTPVIQNSSLPPKVQATGGRVWMKVNEGSEERERRRMSEQMTRNLRLIYNLKQQVDSLQSDLDQLTVPSAGDKEIQSAKMKKAKACIKLGATHRAAMRILTNFQGSPSQQIPPALALLLLQLNLMSSRLGVCGESSYELQQAIEQIKCLHNDSLPNMEKQDRQGQTNRKQIKKIVGKSGNQRQTDHKLVKKSSKTAHNHSTQRRQRHLGLPLHNTAPTTWVQQASAASYKAPASHRGRKRSNKFSLKTSVLKTQQTNQDTPPSVLTNKRANLDAPPSPLTNKRANLDAPPSPLTNQQANQDAPPSPLANQQANRDAPPSPLTNQQANRDAPSSSLTNQQTNRDAPPLALTNQRTNRNAPFSPLTNQQANQNTLLSHLPNQPSNQNIPLSPLMYQDRQTVVNCKQEKMIYPLSELPCPSTSHPVSQGRVAIMLDRLQELENESDIIREKWSTIVYEDPLRNHYIQVDATPELSAKDLVTHPPREPCTLNPVDMLKSISTYKTRYSQYLRLSGLTSRGEFDPWTVAESVADSLLEDQVTAIAKEMEHVCNSCVDTLYGREFYQASN